MSHTMSDRIPAVAAALEELIKDNGILVLANALRSLGWEGKDIDQVVEHSVMDELRNEPPSDLQETSYDLGTVEFEFGVNPETATLTATPPPEWTGWGASYSGMYFNDEGQAFDATGNLVLTLMSKEEK